jgi:hypothetical protein
MKSPNRGLTHSQLPVVKRNVNKVIWQVDTHLDIMKMCAGTGDNSSVDRIRRWHVKNTNSPCKHSQTHVSFSTVVPPYYSCSHPYMVLSVEKCSVFFKSLRESYHNVWCTSFQEPHLSHHLCSVLSSIQFVHAIVPCKPLSFCLIVHCSQGW